MKKNRETHMALLFVIGAAVLAAFFMVLAYILMFCPELIMTVLRYAGSVVSAFIGLALAAYVLKLLRRYYILSPTNASKR